MASIVWGTGVNGDWIDPTKWTPDTIPGSNDDVTISVAGSYTVSIGEADAADSLTLADASASLLLAGAAASFAVANGLVNAGNLDVNTNYADGGSVVTIGGTLTNSGQVTLGNGDSGLGASDTLTAAALVNSGSLVLYGGASAQATVIIQGAAPTNMSGVYSLSGDSLLQFGSGGVQSISGHLTESGAGARVALSGTPSTNSALTGLLGIGGELELEDGASVTTTTNLLVSGSLNLDDFYGAGGSTLTVGGTLTNNGNVALGNGDSGVGASDTLTAAALTGTGAISLYGNGTNEAELNILSAAPGTLTTTYTLRSDALVQFASGGITTIASGADLNEAGTSARVAIAGTPATNSALTGLSSIAGELELNDGASVTTTTNLLVSGSLYLDDFYAAGGSTLTVGGTLTNDGTLALGSSYQVLSNSDTLTAAALVGTGGISLYGNGTNEAELNILSAAPGTLTASYTLRGDALVQFSGGALTSIASGAFLGEAGTTARVALAGTLATNSALTSLSSIAGQLDLDEGASVTTTTNLLVTGTVPLAINLGVEISTSSAYDRRRCTRGG